MNKTKLVGNSCDNPLKLFFVVLITWAFYIDLWNGSLPVLPGSVITVTSIGLGVVIGILTAYTGDTGQRKRLRSWYGIGFLIAVTIAVLAPPINIPVIIEIGLLASFWGSVAGHFVLSIGDNSSRFNSLNYHMMIPSQALHGQQVNPNWSSSMIVATQAAHALVNQPLEATQVPHETISRAYTFARSFIQSPSGIPHGAQAVIGLKNAEEHSQPLAVTSLSFTSGSVREFVSVSILIRSSTIIWV